MTEEEQTLPAERSQFAHSVNRFAYWISRHWLAILNTMVALYVALPMLAPVLMKAEATGPARVIYTVYSPLCHQMASRSFFLFGEQPAYPRAVAGTALTPIEAYMGSLPEFAAVSAAPENWAAFLLAARGFRGNEQMGYKMALCERDMAIYGSVLLAGLLYGFLRTRRNIRPLPAWAFVVFGLFPIAFDGFSQLFSQYIGALAPAGSTIANLLPLRESTPFLRTLTGALFGITLVWLTYPHIDASMQITEANQREKLLPAGDPN